MSKMCGSVLSVIALALWGCAAPRVQVYLRPDVHTEESKILVFPILLFDGTKIRTSNAEYSNPLADALSSKKWSSALGSENTTTIPRLLLDKIPGAYDAINVLIAKLDTTSAIEQTTGLTQFLGALTSQFGDGALAFALVLQDEKEYARTKKVQVNMGLFDTKKLTWKWITKHTYAQGAIPVPVPYSTEVSKLVSESFDALKSENKGLVR